MIFFYLCPPFSRPVSDYLDQYTIQFSGLAVGKHSFDFQADERFFTALESTVIEHGTVNINVELEKTAYLLNLQFSISGTVDVECDRCAVNWPLPLKTENRLILRYSDQSESDEDPDILYISRSDYQFNIAQHIYEYIATAIPFHTVPCEITGDTNLCDQAVLDKLNALQSASEAGHHEIDPRWEVLKELEKNTSKR